MSDDITIAINGVSHPVLCGLCREPITFVGEADANEGDAGCIPCGNIADVREVAQMAIEYAKDEAQLMLNRLAKDAAHKSNIMKFSGQTEHNQDHRFIVDLKL